MALYLYIKEYKRSSSFSRINFAIPKISLPQRFFRQSLSIFFILAGLGFLGFVIWPFLAWQIKYVPQMKEKIVRPIPEIVEAKSAPGDELISASNWFPASPQKIPSRVGSYTLSLPKLKINSATVIIGGDDLSKSLIHYGGSALPGEAGNTVIFGHSVLPQFFNPTNYKTIFSTLHTLAEGEEIFINYDGIEYKYRIFEMKIVDPSDISVLEQKYDDFYLTLITCTPPGTYWKRLIVKAKLEKI